MESNYQEKKWCVVCKCETNHRVYFREVKVCGRNFRSWLFTCDECGHGHMEAKEER